LLPFVAYHGKVSLCFLCGFDLNHKFSFGLFALRFHVLTIRVSRTGCCRRMQDSKQENAATLAGEKVP
jgi:hypothetical protein